MTEDDIYLCIKQIAKENDLELTDKAEAIASSIQVYMTTPEIVFNVITSVLMLVSVVATIFSGYDYLKGGKDLFKDKE